MRPKLKLCGVASPEIVPEAARLGFTYIGMIFAESSPRRVSVETAKRIAAACAAHGCRAVGVFTTHSANDILSIAAATPLDVIQLHAPYPDEDVSRLKAAGYEVWRLYGDATPRREDTVLLDGRRGAESRLADWSLVAPLKREGFRVVLAGALSSANIADAAGTGADILDVNSAVEISPGVKSPALLAELVKAVERNF